jgi:hypothetical protein
MRLSDGRDESCNTALMILDALKPPNDGVRSIMSIVLQNLNPLPLLDRHQLSLFRVICHREHRQVLVRQLFCFMVPTCGVGCVQ